MSIPDVLFDSFRVFKALTPKALQRTSPENVADTLDAVVSLMREDEKTAPVRVRSAAEIAKLDAQLDELTRELEGMRRAVRRYLTAERELRHVSHRPEWLRQYPDAASMADAPEVQEKVDALNALRILSANQETASHADR